VAAYPAEFFRLLRLQDDQLPVRLPFNSEKEAKDWRLHWYGFRKALERELLDDASEISVETRQDLRRTAAYQFVIETEAMLVIRLRFKDASKAIASVLDRLPAGGGRVAPALVDSALEDQDAVVRRLFGSGDGSAAAQHGTPAALPESGGEEK